MKHFKVLLQIILFLSLTACSQTPYFKDDIFRGPASTSQLNCKSAFSHLALKAQIEKESFEINGVTRFWEDVDGSGIIALKGGRDIHSAVNRLIKNAKEKIHIQMSTLNDDNTIELLKIKVREGVKVRVVLSDVTKQLKNAEAKAKNLKLLDEMREEGIDVQIFSSEQLVRQTNQYNPENHRKIVVVDDQYGYLGSANINPYIDNYDLGILVNNKLAKELNNFFINDFSYSSYRRLSEFERFVMGAKNAKFDYLHGSELRRAMVDRVNEAKESIDIAIYDFKDDALLKAIVAKKRENPEIQINVILGPAWKHRTWKGRDISPPQNEKAFKMLKEVGADVRWAGKHLEQTESIVHAKSMVVDQRYVFGGSSDFNLRSFEGNQELSFQIDSRVLGKEFSDSIREETIKGDKRTVHKASDVFKGKMLEKFTGFMAFLRGGKRHFVDKIVWHPAYLRLKLRKMLGKFFKMKVKANQYDFGSRNIINRNPVAARVRFYKALSKINPKNKKAIRVTSEKRVSSSKVYENPHYFYAGYHTRGFQDIEDQGFVPTKGGFYGDGVYIATSPETAIDYSLSRAFQEKAKGSKAHVLLIKAEVKKIYIPERDSKEFIEWVQRNEEELKSLTEQEKMLKYLKQNRYNAIRIIGAEGPKADYLLFLDADDLDMVQHFTIE